MKNSSKHEHNMGIYIRKQEGLYKVNSCHGLLTLKKVGRILRLEYNMLHSFFLRLSCKTWKIVRVKKNSRKYSVLDKKGSGILQSTVSQFSVRFWNKKLWSQHFVKRSFHYHCLDLKYIAPKRFVTNRYMTVQMIRLNLHSFMDLISFDASILKELEAFVTSLSAVSQKVTQVQYSVKGVRYATHGS